MYMARTQETHRIYQPGWCTYAAGVVEDACNRLFTGQASGNRVVQLFHAATVACHATWRGLGSSNEAPRSAPARRREDLSPDDLWQRSVDKMSEMVHWLWGCQQSKAHGPWAYQEQQVLFKTRDCSLAILRRDTAPSNLELATIVLLWTNTMHRAIVALGTNIGAVLLRDDEKPTTLKVPTVQMVDTAPPKLPWDCITSWQVVDETARVAYAAVADFLGAPTTEPADTPLQSDAVMEHAGAAVAVAPVPAATVLPLTHTVAMAPPSAASVEVVPVVASALMATNAVLEPVTVPQLFDTISPGAAAEELPAAAAAAPVPIPATEGAPGVMVQDAVTAFTHAHVAARSTTMQHDAAAASDFLAFAALHMPGLQTSVGIVLSAAQVAPMQGIGDSVTVAPAVRQEQLATTGVVGFATSEPVATHSSDDDVVVVDAFGGSVEEMELDDEPPPHGTIAALEVVKTTLQQDLQVIFVTQDRLAVLRRATVNAGMFLVAAATAARDTALAAYTTAQLEWLKLDHDIGDNGMCEYFTNVLQTDADRRNNVRYALH